MPHINYEKIREAVIENPAIKLEPLNVAMFIRIPGEVNPPGTPSTTPVKIQGMVDVAKNFKPALEITLKDENGNEVKQKICYYKNVQGSQDLVRNFDPNNVVMNMENADPNEKTLGLLLRMRVKEKALQELQRVLAQGSNIPEGALEMLKQELARVKERSQEIENL